MTYSLFLRGQVWLKLETHGAAAGASGVVRDTLFISSVGAVRCHGGRETTPYM